MNRLIPGLALTLVVLVGSGQAQSSDDPIVLDKHEEMNMLLSGTVDIDLNGRVTGYRLDHVEKLPPAVLKLVARKVPHWTFRPPTDNDGHKIVQATMGLNIVARQTGADQFDLRIAGASFEQSMPPEEKLRPLDLSPPRFPEAASRIGLSGTVYSVIKINRNGRVDDVAIEQVNLTVIGTDYQMARGRDMLAQATRAAAKRWTYALPTRGESAANPYWLARVPVDFRFQGEDRQPGTWEVYVPGPRTPTPWESASQDSAAFKPDAMLAGMSYTAGSGLQLLTPLGN